MIATTGKKINGGPAGLNTNLLYRAADLASHFEVEPELAERVSKYLTTPRRSGEKPGGTRIGKHIVVHVNVWIQAYGIVTATIQRSAGGQQS